MDNIKYIIESIKTIQSNQIIDILIGILIYILFRTLSKSLSYITIKIFNPKAKNKKEIRNNPFYKPLIACYILLGAYLGISFIKTSFVFSPNMVLLINKLFRIILILILAKAFANAITSKSLLFIKIKEKVSPNLQDSMFDFILKSIKVLIYIIAVFIIVTELGYNLNGLVAGLGLGGVIITLAAQDTAKNLFGGLVIFIDKPFVVGDWIQVEGYEGTVEDITFRSTRIRTFENSLVNIPNSLISAVSIINWSKMEKRRYKLNLCLHLDTPLEKVEIAKKRIGEMLANHDEIIDDSIIVRFDNITDNGLNLLVSIYTNSINYASFLEEKEVINYKIMQILREEKIELAYDTKTIFVKK